MMEVQKGYHCEYQIHYHIVFPVYRKALLKKEIVKSLQEIAKGIEERYGMEIEQLGSDEDHVHLLCGAHPKYAPGQLVRLFKSITGRELFRRHIWLKKELWGGEFWTDGYYVATVGERGDWNVVEKYVRLQGKEPKEVQLRLW
ncbi:IS200/IS605 family transposase [Candidatus Pacearchaeota archaeon]|nr:IS200/IS605 family transposase [Candidatus Pacearchaeota archaeon]